MSDVEYDNRIRAARPGQNINRTRELQGQSPFIVNTGLNYNHSDSGLQAGLFYNMQERALDVVGTGIIPDVYTEPFHSINFTFSKTFGKDKQSTIRFKATNLLADKKEKRYNIFNSENVLYESRNPGREFSIGYNYKF